MSERKNSQIAHPFVFHGQKAVTNTSEQITGVNYVGWMHVVSNTTSMYIGASGVGANGLPLAEGDTFPIIGSDLSKWYVSGNGSVSFAGNYSRN